MMSTETREDVYLKTTCYGCPAGTCGMIAHRVNGVVVDVRGDPDCPFSQGKLCAKGHAQIMMAYSKRRVTKPLKRTNPVKGIGVDPKWVEISYEEAISIAAAKLRECRDTDPSGMFFSSQDFSTYPWFLGAVTGSFGTPNFDSQLGCGNTVHPTLQQVHGGFHAGPDFHHCDYVMLIGSNKGGMSNWAAVTSTLEMSRARRRGMKLVVIDPICSTSASVADEWVPIRPGTDGALVLSMMNVMINELGLYDVEFLRKLSNGPYLIRDDNGRYVRDAETNKPMIWDESDSNAKAFDDQTLAIPALEGAYTVDGISCKPAFVLLKEHLKTYTPEYASEVTSVAAETVRRLATEFGTAASIGKTIEIDGVTLPIRPACAHWYKGISLHSRSFEQGLAIAMLNTIVGAIDVPGGLCADTVYAHHPEYSENSTWLGRGSGLRDAEGILVPGKCGTYADNFPPPYPIREIQKPASMAGNELVAASLFMSAMMANINVLAPEKFNGKIPHRPQAFVQMIGNPMLSEGNPKVHAQFLAKYGFQLSIVPNVDETAEFADIVIPAQTQLERLDMGANNIPDTMGSTATGEYCINLRQPVVDSPYKHNVDVWIDIADGMGILSEFNAMVNHFMELQGQFKLKSDQKYSLRELTEHWIASMSGGHLTIDDVAKDGRIKWTKTVKERYPRSFYTPRIPLYYEYIIEVGHRLKTATEELGIQWDVSRYQPLPAWYPSPGYLDHTPGFELYAVSFKQAFKTGTFSNFNSWLGELSQYDRRAGRIILNRSYAKTKGIEDGDRIVLETHGGGKVEGVALLSECIHPECVGMDNNGGNWAKSLPPRHARTGVHSGTLLDYDMANLDVMSGAAEASPKLKVSVLGHVSKGGGGVGI